MHVTIPKTIICSWNTSTNTCPQVTAAHTTKASEEAEDCAQQECADEGGGAVCVIVAGVRMAGRIVWVAACVCLHLLSLSILAVGLAFVVRQRQLVGIV